MLSNQNRYSKRYFLRKRDRLMNIEISVKEECSLRGRIVLWILVVLSLIMFLGACQKQEQKENVPDTQEKQTSPPSVTPEVEKDMKKAPLPTKPIITEVPDFTFAKMEELIQKLTQRYGQIQVATSGKSLAGRKLYLLKLGNGPKKINVVAGVHGREGITALLVLKLLEEYASALERGKQIGDYDLQKIFRQVELSVVPMLNPDGVEIAVNGAPEEKREFYLEANEGSDDFERWKANGRGVDLNNQFRADWQAVDSVGKPHFEKYKGLEPESEPESRWLAELARKEKFDAVVAYHNSGSIIFWYYNQERAAYERDFQLAKALSAKNGYQLIEPDKSDIRSAGYKDWFVKEFGRPGFTIEVGDGKAEEPLPSSQLDRYFAENREVLLELAQSLLGK